MLDWNFDDWYLFESLFNRNAPRSEVLTYQWSNISLSQVFMSGRASSMQREIQWTYKHLREEDILDMLAECEADENYSKSSAPGGLGVVGRKLDQ